MITSKNINIIIIGALLLAIVFTGILMYMPGSIGVVEQVSQPEYATKLFDKDRIISIDIRVDESQWSNMLENATKEEYISCDVTINGTTFNSVGIRPKGNSSLSMVANSDSDRYSFKFEFDQYIEGQTCFGLDKLVINNVQADATYMKEYLSYDMMSYLGVEAPLFAYTSVTVNGEDWGFYIAVEALEEAFAQRNFGSDYGMLYKPEGMGARGNGKMNEFINGNNQVENRAGEAPANKVPGGNAINNAAGGMRNGFGGGGGGTDLKYTDDNISSYSNIFDYQVFEGTDTDYNRVVEALKNLSSGTELERYINVDEVLRYIAVNTFVVNLDSYFSNMTHNYYLYEENGQLSMLPWDYNLAFGGFQSGSAGSAINFPIDTPVSGIEMSERPMLAKLLEVDEYKARYHEYLKQIVEGYVNNGTFEATIAKVDSLISQYVKNDASAFFTYEQYTEAVKTLNKYGELRAKSIDGQLDGTIPSTTEGQTKAQDKLIDASSINLSAMGSQGGGGGFGNRADRMGQPNEQMQNDLNQQGEMQPPGGDRQRPDNMPNNMPDQNRGGIGFNNATGEMDPNTRMQPETGGQQFGRGRPEGGFQQQNVMGARIENPTYNTNLPLIGISLVFLVSALVFVMKYKRRT